MLFFFFLILFFLFCFAFIVFKRECFNIYLSYIIVICISTLSYINSFILHWLVNRYHDLVIILQ